MPNDEELVNLCLAGDEAGALARAEVLAADEATGGLIYGSSRPASRAGVAVLAVAVLVALVAFIARHLQPGRVKRDLLQHALCCCRRQQQICRITQARFGRAQRGALCVSAGRMLETDQIVERADKLDRQRPAFADHIQARHAMFMRNVGVNGTDTGNGCDHRHGQGKRSHVSPPKNIKMFRKTHHLPGARSARDQIASIAPRRAGLAGCS